MKENLHWVLVSFVYDTGFLNRNNSKDKILKTLDMYNKLYSTKGVRTKEDKIIFYKKK